MAKLSQLLTLECMLDAYDSLNIKDSWIIERQGVCIVELLDIINPKLKRLINSKTRLSCRNVLVANFETMTNTAHWLKSKLFIDLPKALGKALREKIVQMVDLLKALMVKIIDVEVRSLRTLGTTWSNNNDIGSTGRASWRVPAPIVFSALVWSAGR